MKVLLDENLPHKLRAHLVQHETVTVAYLGWGGLKNGELLTAAEDAGFEVFVTGDRALGHKQNLGARRIAMVSLSANNWPIIKNQCRADRKRDRQRTARLVCACRVRSILPKKPAAEWSIMDKL